MLPFKPVHRRRFYWLIALALGVALVAAGTLVWRFQSRLELARQEAEPFWFEAPWVASPAWRDLPGANLWLPPGPVRTAALYQGWCVYAGEMGAVVVDGQHPAAARRLTALDGLPVNRVTALAELDGRLYFGLGGGGLARWDGRRMERLAWPAVADEWVTTLVPLSPGRLLAATRNGRLLEIQSGRLRAVPTPGLPNDGIAAALPGTRGLVIGTLRSGLYRLEDGRCRRLADSGPPFRQVAALVRLGDGALLAGTDNGLAVLTPAGDFREMLFPGRPVEALGVAAGLIACACTEDALYLIPVADWQSGRRLFKALSPPGRIRGLLERAGEAEFLTDRGVFRLERDGAGQPRLFQPVPLPAARLPQPSVMSLAPGPEGPGWVGYFEGGGERRNAEGTLLETLQNPSLGCVNHLARQSGVLWIGTAQGLWRAAGPAPAPAGTPESPLRDGYINQVLAPAAGDTVWVAHGQGLSRLRGGQEQLFFALHGLPSNKVYCLAERGSRLFAGTLGGLAVLEGERVQSVYQADNSPLRVNWVSALVDCPPGLVVGTYGGGIQLLDSAGRWQEFQGVGRRLNVNPNALLVQPGTVLAGTLEAGLWRLDPAALRGRVWPLPLPSRSVQAVLAAAGWLYVATDNGVLQISLTAETLREHTP